MNKFAIILAAGKGTRMKSKLEDKSKVSYEILGVPLVKYVLDSLSPLSLNEIVTIVGFGAKTSEAIVKDYSKIAYQLEQKGTAHAIMQVAPILENKEGATVILCGDTPLLKSETLKALLDSHVLKNNKLTVLGAHVPNPFGYGRLILDKKGNLLKIVEQKNATEEEQKIDIVNTGVYVFDNQLLFKYLKKVTPNPLTNEYYLTDLIEMFFLDHQKMSVSIMEGDEEMMGINDRYQLYQALKIKQKEINKKLMLEGVTIVDSDNTYIGPYVQIGPDTIVEPNSYIYGETVIGERNIIGPNTYLKDVNIGNDSVVEMSYITESTIHNKVHVGPFARMRTGAIVDDEAKIGNFVELKNVHFHKGVKSAHLSYLGDVEIGEKTNVGCGVIFANYDGVNKFKSNVGKNVFIGSNSTIISPVEIADDSFIAAGSTINKNINKNELAIARCRQENKPEYAAKLRQKALKIKEQGK